MSNHCQIWGSEVRDYEVDFQGIVNNANYFHYLDNARAIYFNKLGINISEYANKKINVVLVKTEICFLRSLTFGDSFYIETKLSRVSRIKFRFDQIIFLEKNKTIVAESASIICCINLANGKPLLLKELENFVISAD